MLSPDAVALETSLNTTTYSVYCGYCRSGNLNQNARLLNRYETCGRLKRLAGADHYARTWRLEGD
jgi:hypothetical protein